MGLLTGYDNINNIYKKVGRNPTDELIKIEKKREINQSLNKSTFCNMEISLILSSPMNNTSNWAFKSLLHIHIFSWFLKVVLFKNYFYTKLLILSKGKKQNVFQYDLN